MCPVSTNIYILVINILCTLNIVMIVKNVPRIMKMYTVKTLQAAVRSTFLAVFSKQLENLLEQEPQEHKELVIKFSKKVGLLLTHFAGKLCPSSPQL